MEQILEIELPAPICPASGQKKSVIFDQLEVISTGSCASHCSHFIV